MSHLLGGLLSSRTIVTTWPALSDRPPSKPPFTSCLMMPSPTLVSSPVNCFQDARKKYTCIVHLYEDWISENNIHTYINKCNPWLQQHTNKCNDCIQYMNKYNACFQQYTQKYNNWISTSLEKMAASTSWWTYVSSPATVQNTWIFFTTFQELGCNFHELLPVQIS